MEDLLPRRDGVVERSQQLFLGCGAILHVDLVEIDSIGLQPLEALVDRLTATLHEAVGVHHELRTRRERRRVCTPAGAWGADER